MEGGFAERWSEAAETTREMLAEANVPIDLVEVKQED
jgi:hypothetical protein